MIIRVPPGTWETLSFPSSQAAGDTAYQLPIDPRLRVRVSVTVSEGTTFSAMWGPSWNLWVSMKRSTFESPLIFSRESA